MEGLFVWIICPFQQYFCLITVFAYSMYVTACQSDWLSCSNRLQFISQVSGFEAALVCQFIHRAG